VALGSVARFGNLLRQGRIAAGLTQEALAERAGLSVHGIQKLERGVTHPYRDTVERLLPALRLAPQDEAELRLAAEPIPRQRSLHHQPVEAVARHNLPVQLTTFVGRERELAEIAQLLAANRLVTLTGAGGCGKTRLALQAATDVIDTYPDGVWFVDLAAVTDERLVPTVALTALGVREEPGCTALDTLAAHLRAQEVLLIFHNCEHLLDTCARLADASSTPVRGCVLW
jgi:transcriptional regulator with XRE-family HTH domain